MKRVIFVALISFLLLGGLFVYQYSKFNDGKLHVIFCNVGQGDGIFIRTPQKINIVVDGGPDDSILSCLSSNMPFWERKIHLMILTHPHFDHFYGFREVIKRYNVLSFDSEKLSNNSGEFNQLIKDIKLAKIPTRYLYAGDNFKTNDGLKLKVIAPTLEFVQKTSPYGMIGENKEFASLIIYISFGEFNLLLTGDSQAEEIKDVIKSYNMKDIDILQVPHHGSKTGLSKEILDILSPKTAVISVGKNRYGHPTQFILDMLKSLNIKTLRTDEVGDIEIISNGNSFKINLKF